MSRAVLILNKDNRQTAHRWIDLAQDGTRVEFRAPKRTLPQNDQLWAMLTEVATQLPWHGAKLSANDWKLLFLDALDRELRTAPALERDGFVTLGRSSSDLSKEEMSQLIDLIGAFGANHGVKFAERVHQENDADGL